MVAFSLTPIIDEDEKRAIYDSKTEEFKRYIPFEKFKLIKADCRKLWEDWRLVESQYVGKQFRIVEDEKWNEGIFINIPATILVLDKWHEDFVKVTGVDFEPFEAIQFIGDKSSPFWQKVQKNHFLLGLLFGFGEPNAKYFQWEHEKKVQYPLRRGTCAIPGHTGKPAHKLKVEDLDVPSFIIYQAIDEQLDKYKLEREKCIVMYKGQDFYKLTTELLKGVRPKPTERDLSEESKLLIKEWVGYNSRIQ